MVRLFRWLLRLVTGLLALGLLASLLLLLVLLTLDPRLFRYFARFWHFCPGRNRARQRKCPHIFGATDEDVYFGLGLAHAQDRLWQMTMLRRTAQGRLSELFGTQTVRVDELLRRFDFYAQAVASLKHQDAYTQAALTAYAAGVNSWLGEVNAGARGRGAPEFWLFEPSIAPWQPADSLVIGKLLALQLSGHLAADVLRARVNQMLPDDHLKDILPDAPGGAVAALPDYAALFDAPLEQFAESAIPDPFSSLPKPGHEGASNAWAAAPVRSAAGGTLLANDPHLELTAPSIWYLARLELASGGVIGGTIPGAPVILVGRSEKVGWAMTSSYADDQDVFIEKLNPENSEEVMTPTGWKPLASKRSIINIKGEDSISLTLRWSDNGPILSGSSYDLGTVIPRGHVASIGWTAFGTEDTSATAMLKLMRAGSIDEAIAAGEDFIAPPQNMTVIDGERIAMQVIGALPRRAARHQTQGRMPAPGWLAENRWQGRLPYGSNPSFVDPEGGVVGNTNNKVIDRPFPLHMSHRWGDTQRVLRWERLMQSAKSTPARALSKRNWTRFQSRLGRSCRWWRANCGSPDKLPNKAPSNAAAVMRWTCWRAGTVK